MKNIVLICCNNDYVPKAIIALNRFTSYNPEYKKVIIGKYFKNNTKQLCIKYNIKLVECDLSNDFIDLYKRPYGKQYPIECFYHFYAYKLFTDYDYIIKIEPDIYTNKKIEIDFGSVNYIGGGCIKYKTINNFNSIKKDYNKIKNIYGTGNINQLRISGGVNIYNVKGLIKIHFYEKIVKYYKTSLKINAPRCGDDSLMVMYQLLNSSHITLFNYEFHVINYDMFNDVDYNKISFFHFAGKTPKYWKIINTQTLSNIQRFFYDNMIEYIYNNFNIEFIKKYIPEIYSDISNEKIPFYYYNGENNFGDLITPYLLNKCCNKDSFTFNISNNNPKIISCGSIMRLCDKNTIVYGSGIRDIDQNINEGIIKSVRGPLTRNRLLQIGCYCPPIYGDLGLLLPLYYNPIIKKKYKLGIIPHYIHYDTVSEMYKSNNDIIVINLINSNIEFVINEILSCEKTISSSLHGLIVSDAYNIPNKWVKFDNNIKGDDTKYFDYFNSVNRNDTAYIDCLNYKVIPSKTYDLIKNVNITYDINYIQEKFFMDKNGIKNYTKYLYNKTKENINRNLTEPVKSINKTKENYKQKHNIDIRSLVWY